MNPTLQRKREILAAIAEALRQRPDLYNWMAASVGVGRHLTGRPCSCVGGLAEFLLTGDENWDCYRSAWGAALSHLTSKVRPDEVPAWLLGNLDGLAAL